MELKTCEYCGTEFNANLQQCPLCGRPVAGAAAQQALEKNRSKGGARLAPRGTKKAKRKPAQKEERIPRGFWVASCIVLGVAVLLGAFYFMYIMGYFGHTSTNEAFQPAETTQPSDTPEDTEPDDTVPEDDGEALPASNDIPCTSLTLSQTDVTLDEEGGWIFLTAVAMPMDSTDEIVFSSSDESVVTVTEIGMVTAVGPGEADIIVTCGSQTEVCHFVCEFETVEPEPEPDPEPDPEPEENGPAADGSDASLSTEDFTLFSPVEKTTLIVRDAPNGATITFESSNSGVVTVSNAGEVTGVGSGTATITVTVNSTKLTCIARCNWDDSEYQTGNTGEETGPCTLSHVDATLFSEGESFTITLTDANGESISGLSWSTSDSSVCSVDGSGRVTATGSGTATVSVTYGGQTYRCIVRCNF